MANSWTWPTFPVAGTQNYESVGRSVLETWRTNNSSIDEEITEGRNGFASLLLNFNNKSDVDHVHTPAGTAVQVVDINAFAFFQGRRS